MHDKPEIKYARADAGSKRFFVTKGRASIDLLERHSVELIQIMRAEPPLRKRAEEAITKLSSLLAPPPARKTGKTRREAEGVRLPSSLVRALDQLVS